MTQHPKIQSAQFITYYTTTRPPYTPGRVFFCGHNQTTPEPPHPRRSDPTAFRGRARPKKAFFIFLPPTPPRKSGGFAIGKEMHWILNKKYIKDEKKIENLKQKRPIFYHAFFLCFPKIPKLDNNLHCYFFYNLYYID